MLSSTKVLFLGRPFWGLHPFHPEPPRVNPQKWGSNNFLHCEFQLSMFSSSKVSFLGRPFWEVHPLSPESPKMRFAPQKTPKFGPNNSLTNNFLHCEFQLSMFSSSKVLFLGVLPPPEGFPIWFKQKKFKYNVIFYIKKIIQSKLPMHKIKKIGSIHKLKMMLWLLNGLALKRAGD